MIARLEEDTEEKEQIVGLDLDTKVDLELNSIARIALRSIVKACGYGADENFINAFVQKYIGKYEMTAADEAMLYRFKNIPTDENPASFKIVLGPYMHFPIEDDDTAEKMEYHLSELVHNACKNSKDNNPDNINITVNYDLIKGNFYFEVSNSGEMPEEERDKIIGTFFDIDEKYEEYNKNGYTKDELRRELFAKTRLAEVRDRYKEEDTRRGLKDEKTRRTQTMTAKEIRENIQSLIVSQEIENVYDMPQPESLGGLGLASIYIPLLVGGGSLQLDPIEKTPEGRVSFTMAFPYTAPLPEFEPIPVDNNTYALPRKADPLFVTQPIQIQRRA